MDWFLAWIVLLAACTVGYFIQQAMYVADFPTLEESNKREVRSLKPDRWRFCLFEVPPRSSFSRTSVLQAKKTNMAKKQ